MKVAKDGMALKNVLVVDDEPAMRHMLQLVLERAGFQYGEAANGAAALDLLQGQSWDAVLCDIRMPEMDGLDFLRQALARGLAVPVIMMSAFGTIDTAVECLKLGAFDYISKPFKPDEVVVTLRKAEERLRLQKENALLRQELAGKAGEQEMLYGSPVMAEVMGLVHRVAPTPSSVLVCGETGTGKELVARALHRQSPRAHRPFVAVNCGAISPGLVESEFFGHARGAFTGAEQAHAGLFGAAHGGTLFLDEIGELPMEMQPKLLRVLQEGELRPVGSVQSRRIDVRVVAATARNLRAEIDGGRFRRDLFYRLAVVEINMPPLRERGEDISLLAEHFLHRIALRENRAAPALESDILALLQNYPWPGNVRELANFMEKAMIFCRGGQLKAEDLPWELRRRERAVQDDYSLKAALYRLEKEYILKALRHCDGNRTQAAQLLEISLRNLQYKLKEYGL
ncbi:sigma-54 dependent transcriptional regulator [Desulfuromonas sp. CSMB_57]|jgi:two-component system response regulator AtoC|uniref:sigma-54-dependent transcriptional regulator n=1 Tax=Desulfuromonas sp. CSMB_57 TaxID=2807629 RepID=UPI001CD40E2A|nr:sigma-54 dependent transcriptional regulator [Desulfuromonas sp. CSMB_57]